MARIKPLVNKILLALSLKGRKISLRQYQVYSEKAEKMVTKYTLFEPNENGKVYKIFEAWSAVEVVKFLANELKKDGDG